MSEDEGTADASTDGQKASKRDRLRGAFSRTKSKFKKQDDKNTEADYNLPQDVSQFLQAGRPSTSDSFNADALPEHPSPRRVPIPQINVSTSLRFPSQRPIHAEDNSSLLRPEYQIRSQSQGTLRPRKNRPRNLSVTFLNAPPVVIGEGGDEAETPPIELARSRARSVSPMPSGRSRTGHGGAIGSPVRRKALPEQIRARAPVSPPEDLTPRNRLARTPTGLAQAVSPPSKSDFDREFDMSLQPGPGLSPVSLESQTSTPASAQSYHSLSPSLHESYTSTPASARQTNQSPLSSRPPPPTRPARQISPHEPTLKPATASHDLRMQYEEGRAPCEAHYRDLSNTSFVPDEPCSWADSQSIQSDAPQAQPDARQLQQLSLNDTTSTPKRANMISPTRQDSSKDEQNPGEWI